MNTEALTHTCAFTLIHFCQGSMNDFLKFAVFRGPNLLLTAKFQFLITTIHFTLDWENHIKVMIFNIQAYCSKYS